ncbi:MAG: TolC family protein [Planctomycetes bacterium]|nr:TolC family protein [Planctomycetota bacterium]
MPFKSSASCPRALVPGPVTGLLLGLLLGFAGCTAPPVNTAWPEPRPLARDLPAYRPADAAGDPHAPRTSAEPEGELTLRAAIALALLQGPDLAAFAWEVRAREARVLQAGLLPNPSLGVSGENLATGRTEEEVTGGIQTTLQVSSVIELGGKRASRVEVAEQERQIAGWDYEIGRIELLSRTAQFFIEVLGAQRRVALLEGMVRLAEQNAATVSERVKAGKVSTVEETKAGVVLARAQIEVARARQDLEAARKALSATWGSTNPRFQIAVGDLDTVAAVPALERLAARLAQNPTLLRLAASVTLRKAAVEAAAAAAVPDVTADAGWTRYLVRDGSDVDTLLLGLSVPLPLFDRNQGAIQGARYEISRSREELRAAEVRVGLELIQSHRMLSTAYSEVVALRATVLPAAESAFDAVSDGYRLGKFGLLDVLDSQRALLEVRSQYLRAVTDYHKAVVDVERLIGERIDSVK